MLKRRDRHGRGRRGPAAWPNPHTNGVVPLRARQSPQVFFTRCVSDALAQIAESCPRALVGVDVGIEDVPTINAAWAPSRVPLAAAVTATPTKNGQVVVYRRPIERRAATRRGIRILVYRTIVEQLANITAIPTDEIDPSGGRDDDWE
ncbi:metallopeptidase family protein [Nigerium massiliense]|uniref:metallopeptidase family protein n=1 Tax=Nigerium massiliense TaxID=1522317 RepID=UPI00058E57EC|nr:metallopeptidase family protein [Nigerium massiliense]